jgi:mannose-6-phosphate isomerase-like protein (cupin superfamily)
VDNVHQTGGAEDQRRQLMDSSIPPFAVAAQEGIVLETPIGGTAIIKVDTSQTDGSLTVIELVIAPKQGPALHTHHRDDELWVVLEGEFRFKAGGAMLLASTGGMAFGPRGTPHAFQNIGDAPGRLLVVTTPSGLEGFFQDFAARLRGGSVGPETLAEVGLAHGLEFVGPPVGVSNPL